MDCPQCGGTLVTYALSGREASVCEDCGYVGIAAEHRGDPRRIESWNDALRRFYGGDEDPSVELRPPVSRPTSDGPGEESWDDALRRFYDRQTGGADEGEETDEGSEGAETDERDDGTDEGSEDEETAERDDGTDENRDDDSETADATDGADDGGTAESTARSRPSQSSAGDS